TARCAISSSTPSRRVCTPPSRAPRGRARPDMARTGDTGMSKDVEVDRIRKMYAAREKDAKIAALWSAFAETEGRHRNQQSPTMAALFRLSGVPSLHGLRVLDVGCSHGRLLRTFLDLGANPAALTGVDVLPKAIEHARRLSPAIDFRVTAGVDLDFPSAS